MAEGQSPRCDVKDSNFLGRFVVDVLELTLPACGCNVRIVIRNLPANDYNRLNFLKMAYVSTLRLCLILRDSLRKVLQNQARLKDNISYDIAYFKKAFKSIIKLVGDKHLQLNVAWSLALCSELALYFLKEKKRFSSNDLVAATASYIFALILPPKKWRLNPSLENRDFAQDVQKLFQEFGDVSELSIWLETFIKRHAVPYETRINVTKTFFREAEKRWKEIENSQEELSRETVIVNLGFVPNDVYDDIKAKSSVVLPNFSEVAWHYIFLQKRTFKMLQSPTSSEKTADGKKLTAQKRLTGLSTSEQTAKGGESSEQEIQSRESGAGCSGQVMQDSESSEGRSEHVSQGSESNKDSCKQMARGGQSEGKLGDD